MSKKLIVQEEQLWRNIVADQNHGIVEVKTPVGNIDVVCVDAIYEVKHVKKWKHALGQILAYGYFYPSESKHIYLFGASTHATREKIKTICMQYNVSVRFTNFEMAAHSYETASSIAETKDRDKAILVESQEIKKFLDSLKNNKLENLVTKVD